MTYNEPMLASPPSNLRGLELWLQHAAGRILFTDVREYALQQIDPALSVEARDAARKSINDALYGLMMVLDGVTGTLKNPSHEIRLRVNVDLNERGSGSTISSVDLFHGDGMCMGYHHWIDGDFGDDPLFEEQ